MDNNWIVLIIRYDKGERRVVPLMKSDDENEDALATFDSKLSAIGICGSHFLAKSSDCIVFNTKTLEAEEY